MTFLTTWESWRRRSDDDRALAVRVAAGQMLMAVALRAVRYGRLLRAVDGLSARRVSRPVPLDRLRWALAAAGERAPGRCLARALTAHFFFRRHGYLSRVCIGVTRGGARLEAHAWVELDGRVLVGLRQPMPAELIVPREGADGCPLRFP